MRFSEIKWYKINSKYQLKNTPYFHHNGLMVKGYHSHKQHIAYNSQYYVSTSGIKTNWLDLTPEIMGDTCDIVPQSKYWGTWPPLPYRSAPLTLTHFIETENHYQKFTKLGVKMLYRRFPESRFRDKTFPGQSLSGQTFSVLRNFDVHNVCKYQL